ncbi:MAG: roadblock/LC7 domain-containing protein [Candidatus Electryoneaceae bacterium]|nr:roadblock/LC7 domain-containing protein [Candidatus Electryoneaceae bacterium]
MMLNLNDVENYLDNLQRTQSVLDRLIDEAGTHGVFVVDDNGFLVAEAGDIEIDRMALAALLAASFEATAEVARILGETDFNRLTHQGKNHHLFIGKAGERHILIVVFGTETNLGLVKLYAEQAAEQLGTILDSGGDNADASASTPAETSDQNQAVPDQTTLDGTKTGSSDSNPLT